MLLVVRAGGEDSVAEELTPALLVTIFCVDLLWPTEVSSCDDEVVVLICPVELVVGGLLDNGNDVKTVAVVAEAEAEVAEVPDVAELNDADVAGPPEILVVVGVVELDPGVADDNVDPIGEEDADPVDIAVGPLVRTVIVAILVEAIVVADEEL